MQRHLPAACQELDDGFPIILGGDCSVTPAVLSGLNSMNSADTKFGWLYIDGDADLTLPSQTSAEGSSAILDSMTMTHLIGRPGGLESMRAFNNHKDGSPLIGPDNIVRLGFDPILPSTEHWMYLLENGYKAFTRPTVKADPVRCAKEALAWLKGRVDVIYVHFDVDVIDSGEFPLANFPHYAGISVAQAMSVLEEVLQEPTVKGFTLTEFKPNNDPNDSMVKRLVDGVVQGMKLRKAG